MDSSASTSLQIPDWAQPGPSSSRSPRHASVAVTSAPMTQPSSKKRASHSVTTSHSNQQEETPIYRDVYAHPAATAFATAHPRRTIPKFGPYLLLQTLGEGEFGKVKLGLHGQWGEEVAVKLIRRGSIDNSIRMSKVEREIEVLRMIKHPNIVRLYDVIETDKYIGIILEYASGGELFDHILAHRYLKEKDACKLFAQLISGVSYIHAKKIVHRDLKLENLLLDRNRNVIITDFGFANRFEHRADDLMQTSCGSPCYAAPELVISEGMYVGSAVDIWSCGVILYAMLAGYLPFDDDPANPDGDNINLLYKYIVNTPLTFPDYISPDARDLLSLMLVPDPKHRSGLPDIMDHRWLAPYRHLFDRSVADLERVAVEQQNAKRQAYQRQMRSHAAEQRDPRPSRTPRSEMPPSRPRQQETLYDSSVQDLTAASPMNRRDAANAVVIGSPEPPENSPPVAQSPSSPTAFSSDEIEGHVPARRKRSKSKDSSRSKRSHRDKLNANVHKTPDKDGSRRKKQGGYRHTIQLEYADDEAQAKDQVQTPVQAQSPPRSPQADVEIVHVNNTVVSAQSSPGLPSALEAEPRTEPPSTPQTRGKQPPSPVAVALPPHSAHLPRSATEPSPISTSAFMAASGTPSAAWVREPSTERVDDTPHQKADSGSTGSAGSRHRRGISKDKFNIGKLLGNGASDGEAAPYKSLRGKKPSHQMDEKVVSSSTELASKTDATKDQKSKSRRSKGLSLMEPLSRTIKERKNRSVTVDTSSKTKAKDETMNIEIDVPSLTAPLPTPFRSSFNKEQRPEANGLSSLSAKTVMNWFRLRSLKRGDDANNMSSTPTPFEMISKPTRVPSMDTYVGADGVSSSSSVARSPVQVIVTNPGSRASEQTSATPKPFQKWTRSPSESSARGSLASVMRNITGVGSSSSPAPAPAPRRGKYDNTSLRIHHGAVDQDMVTSGAPEDVFAQVTKVLLGMGIEMQKESEFKYRCVRTKKRKTNLKDVGRRPSDAGSGYTVFTMVGSAASNGVDKRGLPVPSHTSFTGSGMLRGLLMRRQSSQVSNNVSSPVAPGAAPQTSFEAEPDSILSDSSVSHGFAESLPSGTPAVEPIYGDRSLDQGDEVRFSVELTRIDRLEDTLSLDIRRLKGNLRSYKFLYDTLRERCDFKR